jgi:starvation-inducible DNA-binding protein
MLNRVGPAPAQRPRIFVCGPTGFVERAADLLLGLGHDAAAIQLERSGATGGCVAIADPRRQRTMTMASPATSSHLPALALPHERETLAHELQSTLQELPDLSLIGKQLHWAVVGPAFRPVHEQLDELVVSWRELADVVAERAVALGNVPDGQARAVAAGSPLSSVAADATDSHAVVRAITDRVAQVSEGVRERMDRIAERDAVSHDVLVDVVRTLEHQQWTLRTQLSDRA